MKIIIAGILTAFLFNINSYSFVNILTGPESYNTCSLNRKIDSLVALQVGAEEPGGVIGILSDGHVLVKKNYGIMDMEQKRANNANSVFNIASVAKQFTAFAILMLENEGKLNLDDNIHTYLPGLPVYEDNITIRNLLQHTSGIASTDVLRLFAGISLDEPWSQQDEFEMIKKYPRLNFKPYSRHVYSNGGYSLLARIVESVTGMKFSLFMENHVFSPLDMKTAFVLDGPQIQLGDYVTGYKKENGSIVQVSSDVDYSFGAGNIYASLNDMIKWGQNIFSAKAGVENYLERITTPYNTLDNGDTILYTYGFFVRDHKGVKMVEHSGGVPGFRNQFMMFPDEELLVIVMFNNESVNTRRLSIEIADLMMAGKLIEEAPLESVEVELDRELVKNYEGSYRMPDGMELAFKYEQDTFWLSLPGDERFQLFAESETKFFLKAFDAQCTFMRAGDNNVNEMIWHQGGNDYSALRVEEREPLTKDQLASYAGKYFHKELNAKYPVTFKDGKLTMQTPDTFKKYLNFDSVEISHIKGDRFLTDRLGMLEFTRDPSGRINGFVLEDVGRLQNVRFILAAAD